MKNTVMILLIGLFMVDISCKMDCTDKGYTWGYCNHVCSYD